MRFSQLYILSIWLYLLNPEVLAAATQKQLTITIPQQLQYNIGHNSYILELLEEALERSKKPNEAINVQQSEISFTQARQIAELQRGENLDLIWTMTSIDREAVLRPIRIPLLKGLLGQRVLLVRKDRAEDFKSVNNLQQLRRFKAGQGSHWPDTRVLRHSNLAVVTTTNYLLLFDMLAGGRFDYFPRGANEAWQELTAHPNKPLQVEPSIVLSYIAPLYFFVHQDNHDLAARLMTGLNEMYKDGSFDQHFFEHSSIATMLKNINIDERRTFELDNPFLPKQTPTSTRHYWLNLSQPQTQPPNSTLN